MAPLLKNRSQIRKLAAELGCETSDPVNAIVEVCRTRIREVLREFPHCTTPAKLLDALANKLGTIFEVVRTEMELRQLRSRYLSRGEVGFARIAEELEGNTYGITLRRLQRQLWEPEFVSVIDCRGDKAYRENYTKWHEIGHLLILTDESRLAFRRTHCAEIEEKDPEESLVDIIAGTFAFLPEMIQAHALGTVSFDLLEEIRLKLCPEASKQSAMIGMVKAWPKPCLLVRAELGWRKREKLELQQGSFSFRDTPQPALRAVHVTSSQAAREHGLAIPSNMRIPKQSVVSRVFEQRVGYAEAHEELSWWESSDGKKLPPTRVTVKARYAYDAVDALITLCEGR